MEELVLLELVAIGVNVATDDWSAVFLWKVEFWDIYFKSTFYLNFVFITANMCI